MGEIEDEGEGDQNEGEVGVDGCKERMNGGVTGVAGLFSFLLLLTSCGGDSKAVPRGRFASLSVVERAMGSVIDRKSRKGKLESE